MIKRLLLVDCEAKLVKAWSEVFENFDFVSAHQGDFFAYPADCMVSPANSFGIMDGGLDLAIRKHLGFAVQEKVQRRIVEQFHGELPVGSALLVETGHRTWPYLVVAPTMRVPENIAQTVNAYLSFRAALLAVERFNREAGKEAIGSILCPGLGTGIGGVEPQRCAMQMRMALKNAVEPARIPSFAQIHAMHRALRSS
jgi:O-acetyl-ADP-ribose deacetylase (regulator of RNase III)